MRLTLRTLLAYLDDALEPAQTKLIGQKIQESAVAGKLVSLIRLVVRQRRLKAPSVSGPNVGIDPNVVAQYLDNTLPPEQVVDVEKVLLTSDELLAEVASCHQVMAMVMGKPPEVSDTSRERLYALGPVSQSDQLRVEEHSSMSNDGAAANSRESERVSETPAKTVVATEIPEYLRQSSWSQRVFPAAIVALLVIVCLGLLISDPGFRKAIGEAKKELSKGEADAGKSNSETVVNGGNSKSSDAAAQNQAVAAVTPGTLTKPDNATVLPSPSLPPDPIPSPDQPDGRGKPPADVPADAASVANRTTPPATVVLPANTVPAVPNDPKPILSPAKIKYTSNSGVMLRLEETQRHWLMLPRSYSFVPNERLVVLEPFEGVLDVDQGAIIATVMGDSSFRLLSADRSTSWGLDIRRGRFLIRSGRSDPMSSPVFSIAIGDDLWKLELLAADTNCAIEIMPREPVQFEKSLGVNWYSGVVRVLSGSVKWTSADGRSQQIASDSALEITPQQVGQAALPSPVPFSVAPEWTDSVKRKQSPLQRHSTAFEKNFELEQPVENTLLSLIDHPNAKIVELAVHGLSAIESSMGMVQALAQSGFEEGRFAARDGIRCWLAREADRGPVLKEILEKRYPIVDASSVYILLWGFRPEDATNRATSFEIVNWLRSPHLEIRELAYYWVVHLSSGRKWEFRASEAQARRESAIRKIEAHIATAGALVKPTDREPTPKKPE